ncbi:MAG: hypothetical protein BMS9Abin07_0075 [Acidimicrobiia bacterium]|nr:MAG: hypothetical protein BMS9Abin07_0075 [Acidimicrobiia bacterium]
MPGSVPSWGWLSVYADLMVWIYATTLALGFLALLVWIGSVAVAAWVDGWEFADPEQRFGEKGRLLVAAAVGFGMAGMSATFAGWSPVLATAAALVGGAALAAVARVFAPAQG